MTVLFVLLLVAALGLGAWVFTVGFRRERQRLQYLIDHADEIIAVERWSDE